MREYQQWEQRYDVQGQDHLVPEERLMPEGWQRKRNHEKVERLRAPYKDGAERGDHEYENDVADLVGLLERLAAGEEHSQVQRK